MGYLSADDIADARNALWFGVPIAKIAEQKQVPVDELRAALGMPALKPIPQGDQSAVDIFREVPDSVL
jgi:hypothetical protein